MQVRVAHAGAVHLDETLSRGELLWLLHRMVTLDEDGGVGGYDESGLLGFRYADARRHYKNKTIGVAVLGVKLGEGDIAEAIYTLALSVGGRWGQPGYPNTRSHDRWVSSQLDRVRRLSKVLDAF